MSDVAVDEGVPRAGVIVSVTVSLASISIISIFLTQKYAAVKSWRVLPCAMWLVIGIYLDSYLFVFFTAILKYGLGLNTANVCSGAIYLCLVAYITSKLIYMFLVEKAYIIRGGLVPRLRSKLWCFNTFVMLGGYGVVIVLNFVFRISRLDENGHCVIGMERRALLPLILFDLVLNVYLTSLFLIPLFSLYSFQNKEWTRPTTKLHKMAVRTFIGSLATLTSVIVNLSVLTALNGEPGWVCLLCCNTDVLWSAVMIHWVTYHDHIGSRTHHGSPDIIDGSAGRGGGVVGSSATAAAAAKNANGLHSNASSSHTYGGGLAAGGGPPAARCPYSAYASRRHPHRDNNNDDDDDDDDVVSEMDMYYYHHQQQNRHRGLFDDDDVERYAGTRGGQQQHQHRHDDGPRQYGGGGGDDSDNKRKSRFVEVELPEGDARNDRVEIRRSRSTSTNTRDDHTTTVSLSTSTSSSSSSSSSSLPAAFITMPGWINDNEQQPQQQQPPILQFPAPTTSPAVANENNINNNRIGIISRYSTNNPSSSSSSSDRITGRNNHNNSNDHQPSQKEGQSPESRKSLPLVCRRMGMSPGI